MTKEKRHKFAQRIGFLVGSVIGLMVVIPLIYWILWLIVKGWGNILNHFVYGI